MLTLLLLFIAYPILSKTSEFVCNYQGQCEWQTFTCTDNEDCDIICSANTACYRSQFTCPSSPSSKCNVKCNSTMKASACARTKIYGQNAILSIVITGGDDQFGYGQIDCGNNIQCNIQCGSNSLINNYMCNSTKINGTYSTDLNITGYGSNTLQYSSIHCPNNGSCNITVIGNHGYLIPNSKIYIDDPYTTKLSLKCKANDVLHCYGGKGSEPILFCYNGKYNCSYITDDGIHWHCNDRNSPCNIQIPTTTTPAPIENISTTDFISTEVTSPDTTQWSYSNIQYLVISGLVLIVVAMIVMVTWHKFTEYKKENHALNEWVFYIALIKMICIWLSYAIWIVIIVFMEVGSDEYYICGIIMYFCFTIGWMALYVFMLNKLYYTFKDSIYRMSRKYLYFHGIILIFIPIWYSLITLSNTIIPDDNVRVYLSLSLTGSIIIFIGLLTLIVSFNRKLLKVIISTSHSLMNCNDSNNDGLLQLITKQTLLGSTMIFNMIIFVVIVLILTCLRSDKHSTEWIIYEWILALLIIINCLSIFFGFKINENEYNKLYTLCHNKLISFCRLLAVLMNPNDQSLIDRSLAKNVSSDLQFEDALFVHQ